MTRPIEIEVVSDFACPWCLVGERRLGRAIASRPALDLRVRWTPFQLNPAMPRAGRNRREYYAEKFGAERFAAMRASLAAAGAEDGLVFCDTPDAMAPNTLSAHVLMLWGTEAEGVDEHALAERLFRAHHVDCEDLGAHDVLARIAGESGLDADEVRGRLTAGEDEDRVRERIRRSAERGVTGVPLFVLDGQYGLSGAQPAEVLAAAFDQLASGAEPA